MLAFISDHFNALKRMTFSKWNRIFFWGTFVVAQNHWMYHVHNLNVNEQLFCTLHITCKMCVRLFLFARAWSSVTSTGITVSVVYYRRCHWAYAVHTQAAQFLKTVKSCHCWHKKCDLGTSWKLHILLRFALKYETYLCNLHVLCNLCNHESIAYGGRKVKHMITFT